MFYIKTPSDNDQNNPNFCYLNKGKIIFYQDSYDNPSLKEYLFDDATIIGIKEIFVAEGETPMTMSITISSAIQNFGALHVKSWNESYISPDKLEPYRPIVNQAPKLVEVDWINQNEEIITEAKYSDKVTLRIETRETTGGEIQAIITKEDKSEIEKGKSEIKLTKPAKNGKVILSYVEIKEQWENFKKSDIDQLVANIEYKGTTITSKPLEIIPQPEVIVDFRPSKNYDGEYGFDYMRDTKEKDDNLTYKDILGTNTEYDKTNKKRIEKFKKYATDTKYDSLKNDHYKTTTFSWYKDAKGNKKEYIKSWLTIYPGEKATLSLQIDTIGNPKNVDLTFDYDKTFFKLSTDTVPAKKKEKYD